MTLAAQGRKRVSQSAAGDSKSTANKHMELQRSNEPQGPGPGVDLLIHSAKTGSQSSQSAVHGGEHPLPLAGAAAFHAFGRVQEGGRLTLS